MKKSSGALVTNAVKSKSQEGSVAVTTPVQANLKSGGKAAPKAAVKAKQKTTPMMPSKRLGNHWG